VFVSAKLPVAAIFVTVSGVSPLLVMTTVWGALVVLIVVGGNTKLDGENCTCATPVTPVPVSVTRCGLPEALSVMESNSVSGASTVGV